jgi:hypothetical protein
VSNGRSKWNCSFNNECKKAIWQNFDGQMRDNTKSLLKDLRNRMQISQTILRLCHKRNINQKMLMEGNKDRVLISLICNTEIFRSALQILWLDGDLYLQSRLRKQIRLIDCNLQWRTQYHFQWQHFLHTGKRKLCI